MDFLWLTLSSPPVREVQIISNVFCLLSSGRIIRKKNVTLLLNVHNGNLTIYFKSGFWILKPCFWILFGIFHTTQKQIIIIIINYEIQSQNSHIFKSKIHIFVFGSPNVRIIRIYVTPLRYIIRTRKSSLKKMLLHPALYADIPTEWTHTQTSV